VFHSFVPYNGGYRRPIIETLGPLMQWLKGSSWEVTDPMQANLFGGSTIVRAVPLQGANDADGRGPLITRAETTISTGTT